ncbi:SDR family NAD(P)-dependent oxidoreductase [Clostridium sp. MCC353]|uniref:SDR family NAD(P)-dependent oxidoreductase n=1 Tax=Clostridium sp. MCC353 TaxID=2592646 RepID=UPI001C0197A8|nr:SDR family NAD(P)-dependent oxidoreductase [Clostridium sp. MCC353]MBT9775897.1 SDR family NAD(P)-dependent oxidoreductase [Clostridium sp. MCC353]
MKTLILVGAGKGLGNAIAREFASHDFRVVLISRSEAHLKEYAEELHSEGIETYIKTADALYPETLTKAINEVVKELGTPDALVYNVGITQPDGDREITNELLMERYQIDAASAWHCASLVATDEFAAKSGAILFTGGGFAKTFQPILSLKPLCIDKAALNAMNIVLHHALEPRGIFVGSILVSGVIAPGDEKYDPAVIAKQYWDMYTERRAFDIAY